MRFFERLFRDGPRPDEPVPCQAEPMLPRGLPDPVFALRQDLAADRLRLMAEEQRWRSLDAQRQARVMTGRTMVEEQAEANLTLRDLDNIRFLLEKQADDQKQADKRATELLLENLNEAQRKDFLSFRHFRLKSTLYPGAYYLIYVGRQGNIYFHGTDGQVKQLCATSIDFGIPVCDVMLVQKLMIECDEAGFLAVANDLTARVEEPYVRFGTPRGIQGHGGGGALGSGVFAALQLVTVLVAVVALVATL